MNNDCYVEFCNNTTMMTYPFFLDKLKQIESLIKLIKLTDLPSTVHIAIKKNKCTICSNSKYYKLSNIIWSNQFDHIINYHKTYPSEYFLKIILNMMIINNKIINKPIILSPDKIEKLNYVPLYYNKLLIIDALFKQGSYPRYENKNKSKTNQYIYSEHTGVLSIKNNTVENIIIHGNTDRSDPNDQTIFLPNNAPDLINYEYLFHTHPNTPTSEKTITNGIGYAGRINEGILYEFPSANDIFNFVKYYMEGKAQGSIIVAPEGAYIIRLINFEKEINIDNIFHADLKKLILKLEQYAINKLEKIINKLSDPDTFHKYVGSNFKYINNYNKFIAPHNIYIEYYPREKKNNEWCLRSMFLSHIGD